MKKELIIKVDSNDADYVEVSIEVDNETIANIRPVIKAIKQFKEYRNKSSSGLEYEHRHNWPSGEMLREDLGEKSPEELYLETGLCTEDEFETFVKLLPYIEYGFHTINSIRLLEIVKDDALL